MRFAVLTALFLAPFAAHAELVCEGWKQSTPSMWDQKIFSVPGPTKETPNVQVLVNKGGTKFHVIQDGDKVGHDQDYDGGTDVIFSDQGEGQYIVGASTLGEMEDHIWSLGYIHPNEGLALLLSKRDLFVRCKLK